MRDKTFLIMAGGTGGHVFPALATAQKLIANHDKVVWLGSEGGMEESVVKKAGIPFYGLSIKGVRGKGMLSKMLAPLKIMNAVRQAISVIRKEQPDCVLGMGGFASGPGGLAARVLGKPLLIHEQNAVAGMTNKILSRLATTVMEAFKGSFPGDVDTRVTGNPLREDVCRLYYQPKKINKERKLRLLVLGGSLGAVSLNKCLPEALSKIESSYRPEVWHQAGQKNYDDTVGFYEDNKVDAKVSAFIDDMSEAYSWADFVVCRAGALTVSELCVAGLGAILIPYPYAVDDHQTLNARWMEQAGAAWLLPQSEMNPEALSEMLRPLLTKRERIIKLSESAHKLGQPDATDQVAEECRRVCYA